MVSPPYSTPPAVPCRWGYLLVIKFADCVLRITGIPRLYQRHYIAIRAKHRVQPIFMVRCQQRRPANLALSSMVVTNQRCAEYGMGRIVNETHITHRPCNIRIRIPQDCHNSGHRFRNHTCSTYRISSHTTSLSATPPSFINSPLMALRLVVTCSGESAAATAYLQTCWKAGTNASKAALKAP